MKLIPSKQSKNVTEIQKTHFADDETLERLTRYERTLEEIANSKYCNYENTEGGQYGIGVTDGHRYCAKIARKALTPAQGGRDE